MSRFFFFLSSSSEVGVGALVEVAELRQEGILPLLGLILEALLERLLVEAPSLVTVTTAVLVAPTLLIGASLFAVAVAVVVEVVVLATTGLLGAIGDEVVQIAAVVEVLFVERVEGIPQLIGLWNPKSLSYV